MNKKIQSMFEKSCWDNQMKLDIKDFVNIEEFAKLIILECAVVANQAENNDSEFRCMYEVVTEHFGVK